MFFICWRLTVAFWDIIFGFKGRQKGAIIVGNKTGCSLDVAEIKFYIPTGLKTAKSRVC